jgi:hypothetical protein
MENVSRHMALHCVHLQQKQNKMKKKHEVALHGISLRTDNHRRVTVLARLFQPPRKVCERLATRDVVHQQRAGRAAVRVCETM